MWNSYDYEFEMKYRRDLNDELETILKEMEEENNIIFGMIRYAI